MEVAPVPGDKPVHRLEVSMMRNGNWIIEEIHGAWWAYEPPRPPDRCFFSHGRPTNPPIKGPFNCREYAEFMKSKNWEKK
jgi:hypothetical protein